MNKIKSVLVALCLGIAAVGLAASPANATVCVGPLFDPCADPGGPYSITLGDDLFLDGSGSASPFGAITTYVWDLDGIPGGEVNTPSAMFTVPFLTYSLLGLGVGSHTITLFVVDDFALVDSAETTLDITEAIPEPGTLAIFGLGLAGLGLMRRRRVTSH